MSKEYVKTSDMPYAAFLMLHDYTAIACVDPGNNTGRLEFYLTHADEEVRNKIDEHASLLRDELMGSKNTYLDFHYHLRRLRKMTYEPVKKPE